MKKFNFKSILVGTILLSIVFTIGCGKSSVKNDETNNSNLENLANGENLADQNQDNNGAENNVITFGTYNGEAIEWQVLEEMDDKKILLSKYILDAKPFNDEDINVSWDNSTIRKWLNGEFYESAFSSDEKSQILKSKVENLMNEDTNMSSGSDTEDYVYLLSIDEVKKYFYKEDSDNKFIKELATKKVAILDEDKIALCPTKNKWYSENSPFWLRTTGLYEDDAAHVNFDGYVSVSGTTVNFAKNGIRPVLAIKK